MPSLQKSFRSALEKQRASALTTPPSLLSPKSDSEADGDPAKGGMALAVVQDMLKTRTDELEDVQQQLQTRVSRRLYSTGYMHGSFAAFPDGCMQAFCVGKVISYPTNVRVPSGNLYKFTCF